MKIPQSVLVVIHTPVLGVLLIERADAPGVLAVRHGLEGHRRRDVRGHGGS